VVAAEGSAPVYSRNDRLQCCHEKAFTAEHAEYAERGEEKTLGRGDAGIHTFSA